MRRIPILAKLLGAYLVPALAVFAGFSLLAHRVARRALEEELGRRLMAVAAAAASEIAEENIALLAPGDEQTRTYRNVARRLGEVQAATGVARVYLFALDGTSRCDTRAGVPIGERYYWLDAWQSELARVAGGVPAASVLFRGRDGVLYKSGIAPLRDVSGRATFAVAVDGAASLYEQLAGLRRTLVAVGFAGTLAIVLLSVVVARWLVRPIRRLARAAERIGAGDLQEPVHASSRDEVGFVAETMEQMRQQLRARDERTQMMLAGIAHEVRNPLAGLELYTGILREDLAGDAEKLAHVKRLERELGHLKAVVTEFLDYARRPRPELSRCDVAQLLGEVRDLAAAAAEPLKIAVRLESEPALVAGDPAQLRRALLNLVTNAVQACPQDGSGEVHLRCARRDSEVVVTVQDSGAGIDPDRLPKIWAPFYTSKQRGTGLGLAFVREIATEHGARVAVDSTPGRGTTFTLALPAATQG
jgi:signal transduction histidine kinase